MNKTILAVALSLTLGTAFGDDEGGSSQSDASSVGVGVGVGIAGAAAGAKASANNRNSNVGSVYGSIKNRVNNKVANRNNLNNANHVVNDGSVANRVHLSNAVTAKGGNQHQGQSLNNVNDVTAKGGNQRQGQSLNNRNKASQGQSQSSKQANAQSMTYNESEGVRYSGSYKLKNTPSMALGGIDPTVPCAIPLEGSYSGPGIGVGLGSAYVDKGCELRELIRLGMQGNAESNAMANQLLQAQLQEAMGDQEQTKIAPKAKTTDSFSEKYPYL